MLNLLASLNLLEDTSVRRAAIGIVWPAYPIFRPTFFASNDTKDGEQRFFNQEPRTTDRYLCQLPWPKRTSSP